MPLAYNITKAINLQQSERAEETSKWAKLPLAKNYVEKN